MISLVRPNAWKSSATTDRSTCSMVRSSFSTGMTMRPCDAAAKVEVDLGLDDLVQLVHHVSARVTASTASQSRALTVSSGKAKRFSSNGTYFGLADLGVGPLHEEVHTCRASDHDAAAMAQARQQLPRNIVGVVFLAVEIGRCCR